jgi:threonine/homoserine/homoserine lactone efflux protein
MFIEVILLFLVTAIISFVGSLTPGPVNVAVFHTAINGNLKQSLAVAIGGALPEILYSALAMWCSIYILYFSTVSTVIYSVSIVLFVVFGIILFFDKSTTNKYTLFNKPKHSFLFGFCSGILNPMLFTFWLMVITLIQNSGYFLFDSLALKISFVVGCAVGAFILLALVSWFAIKKRADFLKFIPIHPSRITGILFIILAAWQAFNRFV